MSSTKSDSQSPGGRVPRESHGASQAEVEAVVAAVVEAHDAGLVVAGDSTASQTRGPQRGDGDDVANLLGILSGECARRGIEDAYSRELVFNEMRRYASNKAKDKTFEQLAEMLKDPGRRASLKGFVFEGTDKHALDALAKISAGRTRTVLLNGAHNTKAVDGQYVVAARKAGAVKAGKTAAKATHMSHKCSSN